MIRVVVLLLGCLGAGAAGFAETQVWLDVDVAAGIPQRDVDDALAMIQAFHSPSLGVRGVSGGTGGRAGGRVMGWLELAVAGRVRVAARRG